MGGVQKVANNATANISPKAVGSMGGKGGAAPMPTRPQMPPQVQPPMGGMNPKGGGMPMPPQRPPMGMGGQMHLVGDNFERINSEMYAREQANAGQPSVAMNRFGQVAPQYGQIPSQYGGFGQMPPQVPSYAQPGGMNGKGGMSGQIDPAMAAYARALQGQSVPPAQNQAQLQQIQQQLRGLPQQSGLAGLGRFGGML